MWTVYQSDDKCSGWQVCTSTFVLVLRIIYLHSYPKENHPRGIPCFIPGDTPRLIKGIY